MRSLDDFLKAIEESEFVLDVKVDDISSVPKTEALFHLPLLAISILVVANRKKNKLLVSDVGYLTGVLLAETFPRLKTAASKLRWSLRMRKQSAEAVFFLESTGLIVVSLDESRSISLTEKGKTALNMAATDSSDLALLISRINRAYRRSEDQEGLFL